MTSHCAKFTDAILAEAVRLLPTSAERVLDPFAGTGKGVDYLRWLGWDAWGVELEPEWASMSPHVVVGNALALPFADESFDAVFTSPCYGNRMADKDMRPSVAGTYAKSLGRIPSDGSAAVLQWGDEYRRFHRRAWAEVRRVLKPGGYFLLNVKNHIRAGKEQRVTEWHIDHLTMGAFVVRNRRWVGVPGLRVGANGQARVGHETLVFLQKRPASDEWWRDREAA